MNTLPSSKVEIKTQMDISKKDLSSLSTILAGSVGLSNPRSEQKSGSSFATSGLPDLKQKISNDTQMKDASQTQRIISETVTRSVSDIGFDGNKQQSSSSTTREIVRSLQRKFVDQIDFVKARLIPSNPCDIVLCVEKSRIDRFELI